MVDPDLLYTIAQVGVTYAGFSTLVTVVAYRRDMKALRHLCISPIYFPSL
jgi:hypothetical protein